MNRRREEGGSDDAVHDYVRDERLIFRDFVDVR